MMGSNPGDMYKYNKKPTPSVTGGIVYEIMVKYAHIILQNAHDMKKLEETYKPSAVKQAEEVIIAADEENTSMKDKIHDSIDFILKEQAKRDYSE